MKNCLARFDNPPAKFEIYGEPEDVKSAEYLAHRDRYEFQYWGVIIASSTQGYKIPASEHDLKQFARHVASITVPYLDRLEHARDIFRTGTGGEIDFLSSSEFFIIKELVKALKNVKPQTRGAWVTEGK